MAKEIFRYAIYRVAVKKPLKRGEIRRKKLEQAVKAIQRKIKKIVVKQHVPLFVRIWNAEDETERFEKQYDQKKDFKGTRKPPKWRQKLSARVAKSRTFSPEPKYWFVAIGKRGQVDVTKLSHEPTKQSLLRKKRRRVIGPFESEEAAMVFKDKVLARLDEQRKTTDFSQQRRYKGPMEEVD